MGILKKVLTGTQYTPIKWLNIALYRMRNFRLFTKTKRRNKLKKTSKMCLTWFVWFFDFSMIFPLSNISFTGKNNQNFSNTSLYVSSTLILFFSSFPSFFLSVFIHTIFLSLFYVHLFQSSGFIEYSWFT